MKIKTLGELQYWVKEFARQDLAGKVTSSFKPGSKTMVIDGVSYFYGNVGGIYHFYPKNNKLYNEQKVAKFVEEMGLPRINEAECARDEFGHCFLGFEMTRDSFIHKLPYYMYYTENNIQAQSFMAWMSGEQEETKKPKRNENREYGKDD